MHITKIIPLLIGCLAVGYGNLQQPASNGSNMPSFTPQVSEPVRITPNDTKNPQLPQEGRASFYADRFHGRPTASGEIYDSTAMTAAHRKLPFGTKVKVTNLKNQKSVVVTINDRGPHLPNRIIDLSKAAARELGFIDRGVTRVRIEEAK